MKKVTTVLAVLMLSSSFFVGAQNVNSMKNKADKHKGEATEVVNEKIEEAEQEVKKVKADHGKKVGHTKGKAKGKAKGHSAEFKAEKEAFKKERVAYKGKKVAMKEDVKDLRDILKAEKEGTSTLSEAESKAKKVELANDIEKQRDELKKGLKLKEDHLASLKERVAKAETKINESAATDSEEVKANKSAKLAKAKEHVAKLEGNLKKENLRLDNLSKLIARAKK